jgi:hypothetical protein
MIMCGQGSGVINVNYGKMGKISGSLGNLSNL